MTTVLSRFDALAGPFTEVVDQLPEHAWGSPSACAGWTARDVLEHVMSTQRDFFAQRGLDLAPGPDQPMTPAQAWHAHLSAVRPVLADEALMARSYQGYFGETTIGATVLDFYGFDLVPHRWDLAQAAGIEVRFSSGELDLLESSIEALGDNLYQEGVCAPALPVGPDADRQSRALARLGRRG